MTDKQKLFVEYYLRCWNATEAARQAGYAGNLSTLTSVGSENMTKPDIEAYISKRMDEVSMSTNEILHRLTEWGRGTVEPFLTEDGFSEAIDVNSEEARKAVGLIKKIKQDETALKAQTPEGDTILKRKFEIELHDAKDAVIQLAKIRGMYTKKVKHSGEVKILKWDEEEGDPAEYIQQTLHR